MFDWNDEKLTSIIWGDDWERNNCIGSFSDQIEDLYKKGTKEQISSASTVAGKKFSTKSENGVELDRVSVYDVGEAYCPDSWPAPADPSRPNAAKTEHESVCIDECSYLKEDEASEWDNNSAIFEKPADDEEERDSVFYGWANIGSFEDLDRMFSDSDTIFGDFADTNADALWSSSKDLANVPPELTQLSGDSNEQSEITDHNVLYPGQSSYGYQKMNDVNYKSPHVQASKDIFENSGGKNSLLGKEKTFVTEGSVQGSRKVLNDGAAAKHNGTSDKETSCSRSFQSQGNRHRRSKGHFVPSMVNPSLEIDQQSPAVHSSQNFQLKHLSSVHQAPTDGSTMNYYAGPPVLLSSGFEAPPTNANSSGKSGNAPAKPPPMTPREKIEKLRKRQQMRAILAIQKQQMHFNNQASVSENLSMEGGKGAAIQSVSNLPVHETSSVTGMDDPRTVNMAIGNFSVEESILYQLQEAVAKLDMRIRLSIRDSLFRLAKSAMQRQYPNDTYSTCASSRNDACSNKDMIKNQRLTKVTEMEMETNPIDRTVARLLFHVGLSGKLAETSESPSSKSIAYGHLPDVSESSQMTSSHGMKSSSMFSSENRSVSTSFYQGRVEMEAETCN